MLQPGHLKYDLIMYYRHICTQHIVSVIHYTEISNLKISPLTVCLSYLQTVTGVLHVEHDLCRITLLDAHEFSYNGTAVFDITAALLMSREQGKTSSYLPLSLRMQIIVFSQIDSNG